MVANTRIAGHGPANIADVHPAGESGSAEHGARHAAPASAAPRVVVRSSTTGTATSRNTAFLSRNSEISEAMPRFDVYEAPGRFGYLLDVQADVLHELSTRMVVPLVPAVDVSISQPRLHPRFDVHGAKVLMATHFMAAVPRKQLSTRVSSPGAPRFVRPRRHRLPAPRLVAPLAQAIFSSMSRFGRTFTCAGGTAPVTA